MPLSTTLNPQAQNKKSHICLFVCLGVCLFVCLFGCLGVCLFVCLFVWVFVRQRMVDCSQRLSRWWMQVGSSSLLPPNTFTSSSHLLFTTVRKYCLWTNCQGCALCKTLQVLIMKLIVISPLHSHSKFWEEYLFYGTEITHLSTGCCFSLVPPLKVPSTKKLI